MGARIGVGRGMAIRKFNLLTAFGAALLCATFAAHAQDNAVGPAQLKDFQLRGNTVTQAQPQPQQQPPQPVTVAPPPPSAQPAPTQNRPVQPATTRQQAPTESAPAASAPTAAEPVPPVRQPQPDVPEAAPPGPAPEGTGGIPWLYVALGGGALALLGFALFVRRRKRAGYEVEEAEERTPLREPLPLTAREKAVRPEPVPRPWLELDLKAERAVATLTETVVQFELEIRNTGQAAASNLRIDVKMFNAGKTQEQELSAFFRVAGRESTKCHLPGIAAGVTGVIHGQVTMAREDMKAVQLEEKLLFIPVIGVNALYDWGEGETETGQTSRSWVVGRELETPSEKMGAFRVDLGPRTWRTVGQRQHKLARQV